MGIGGFGGMWDEAKHPRDKGKFAPGSGGGAAPMKNAPAAPRPGIAQRIAGAWRDVKNWAMNKIGQYRAFQAKQKFDAANRLNGPRTTLTADAKRIGAYAEVRAKRAPTEGEKLLDKHQAGSTFTGTTNKGNAGRVAPGSGMPTKAGHGTAAHFDSARAASGIVHNKTGAAPLTKVQGHGPPPVPPPPPSRFDELAKANHEKSAVPAPPTRVPSADEFRKHAEAAAQRAQEARVPRLMDGTPTSGKFPPKPVRAPAPAPKPQPAFDPAEERARHEAIQATRQAEANKIADQAAAARAAAGPQESEKDYVKRVESTAAAWRAAHPKKGAPAPAAAPQEAPPVAHAAPAPRQAAPAPAAPPSHTPGYVPAPPPSRFDELAKAAAAAPKKNDARKSWAKARMEDPRVRPGAQVVPRRQPPVAKWGAKAVAYSASPHPAMKSAR